MLRRMPGALLGSYLCEYSGTRYGASKRPLVSVADVQLRTKHRLAADTMSSSRRSLASSRVTSDFTLHVRDGLSFHSLSLFEWNSLQDKQADVKTMTMTMTARACVAGVVSTPPRLATELFWPIASSQELRSLFAVSQKGSGPCRLHPIVAI